MFLSSEIKRIVFVDIVGRFLSDNFTKILNNQRLMSLKFFGELFLLFVKNQVT